MKKFLFPLLIITGTCSSLAAQDSLVIPKGVVYYKIEDEVNDQAKAFLLKELSPSTVSYSLFSGMVFCGPRLWQRLKQNKTIAAIEEGNVSFRVPTVDENGKIIKREILEGKLLQTKTDFKLVWDQLLKDFSTSSIRVRKLTAPELNYYWSIISFDIKEPLFVAENASYKIIFDMAPKNAVAFIEQL